MYSLVGRSTLITITNITVSSDPITFDFRMGESLRVQSGDFFGVEVVTGSPIAEDAYADSRLCPTPAEETLVAITPVSVKGTQFEPLIATHTSTLGLDYNSTACIKYGVQAIVVYDDDTHGEYSNL